MNARTTIHALPARVRPVDVLARADVLGGELLGPEAGARVVGRLHPLRDKRIDCIVPAGSSVLEALTLAIGAAPGDLLVQINGKPLPDRAWWPRVRLKPGVTLTFLPRLSGDNPLRTVLQLALVVAAIAITAFLGPVWGAFPASLLAAAVVIGGNLAINALFPIRPPQQVTNGDRGGFIALNSIQGARNQAAPFEAIPLLLGQHRQSPLYGARPYTEIIGDDQYLRLLFVWGYGPLEIPEEDLKIGETPLSSFPDCEIETRQGFDDDDPITLYPAQVNEEPLSIELTFVGSWQQRTTAPDTDEISIDVTAPQGAYRVDGATGIAYVWPVAIEAEYSVAGAGSWVSLGTLAFGKKLTAQRLGLRLAVARGQYDVRVRRTTADKDSFPTSLNITDATLWTALRSFRNDPPVAFGKPLAMTAMRIRATDQLSGVIDTFNGINRSLVTSFTGTGDAWDEEAFSNNPADLFRHALQCNANARPRSDDEIDLDNLQEWWDYCADNGFTFNQVRTQRSSVYDLVADIAAAGRAVPTFIDGKWGVIWDRPNDTIVDHFTPRNSWGFAGSRPYPHLPHAWRVRFINEDNGYTQDERIVYRDGYDAGNATLFEGIEFPGVTDPDLIWKHGRFHLAQIQLRPEEITLSVGWEHLVVTRGDRVVVAHDAALIGQISGRVKTVVGQVVTLDETVTMEVGKTYGIRFRNADLGSFMRSVVFDLGEQTEIELSGTDDVPEPGDLFSFGETAQETAVYRVKAIRHQKDLIAQLVLVDDAPEISTADSGTIPAYSANVTIPPDPYTLPPQDLKYDEVIDGLGAAARALVRLTWQMPPRGVVAFVEVQSNDLSGDGVWTRWELVPAPNTTSDVPFLSPGPWGFRVRCIFADGTVSAWNTVSPLTLAGLIDPPDDIENFRATFITGRSYLTWDPVIDTRGLYYEVRKGATWDAALMVGDAIAQPQFQTIGDDTYWIAAYVVTPFGERIYSETRSSVTLEDSVLIENVVVSYDERDEEWPGERSTYIGIDEDNNYLRTAGANDILDDDDILDNDDLIDVGGQLSGTYYSPHVVDNGRVGRCRVSVDYTAVGQASDSDVLALADVLAESDILQTTLTAFVRVYPLIRTSQTEAGDDWSDWIKWSPDVYVGWRFQLGLFLESLDGTTIALVTAFGWTVDVEDRNDRYQSLTVPVGGLPIVFEYGGYNVTPSGSTAAFRGGPNNAAVPHITALYLDAPTGQRVVVRDITAEGATVSVLNTSDTDVGGSGVNVYAQGY